MTHNTSNEVLGLHYGQHKPKLTINNKGQNQSHKHKQTQIPNTPKSALTITRYTKNFHLTLFFTQKLDHDSISRIYHTCILIFLSMWDYHSYQELLHTLIILLAEVGFQNELENLEIYPLMIVWLSSLHVLGREISHFFLVTPSSLWCCNLGNYHFFFCCTLTFQVFYI